MINVLFTFIIFIQIPIAMATVSDETLRELFRDHGVRSLERLNPSSVPLFVLGEKLFSDTILSGNRNISCQTCHHPLQGSSDALPLSIGEGGEGQGASRSLKQGHIIPRNAPPLWNLAHAPNMFWDMRVARDPLTGQLLTPEKKLNGIQPELAMYSAQLDSALAAQAMFPPTSHEEMSGQPGSNEIADAPDNETKWQRLTARVVGESGYQTLLREAFPHIPLDQLNFAHLARAIAEFEKISFQAVNTPLDRFLNGDNSALNEVQKQGAHFFLTKGKCIQCHNGPLLTDFKTHVVGFPQIGPGKNAEHDDLGRMNVTNDFQDRYAFRTPPLRQVILSGPWGHDGSFRDMRDLLLHYFHPPRTFNHYVVDNSGLPYELKEEEKNKRARFQALDARVRPGFAMNQEELTALHDFIVFSLTEK